METTETQRNDLPTVTPASVQPSASAPSPSQTPVQPSVALQVLDVALTDSVSQPPENRNYDSDDDQLLPHQSPAEAPQLDRDWLSPHLASPAKNLDPREMRSIVEGGANVHDSTKARKKRLRYETNESNKSIKLTASLATSPMFSFLRTDLVDTLADDDNLKVPKLDAISKPPGKLQRERRRRRPRWR